MAGNAFVLSKTSGVPQSTLANYFKGGEPGREHLVSLAKAARVDLLWLATGEGEKQPNRNAKVDIWGDGSEYKKVSGELDQAEKEHNQSDDDISEAEATEMMLNVIRSKTIHRAALFLSKSLVHCSLRSPWGVGVW